MDENTETPRPEDAAPARPEAAEPYEPPKLLKFERLEKLIVSGE
jgi:hypothetical protein